MSQLFTNFDDASVIGDVLAYEPWSPSSGKALALSSVAWDTTQACGFGSGPNARHFARLLDIPLSNNIEIYGLLKADGSGENDIYVGGNSGYNAYKFDIRSSGLRLTKFEGGVGAFGMTTAPSPFATGDVVHIRCSWDASTGSLKLRVWPELDPEPLVWDIDATNTDITSPGTAGLFTFSDSFSYSRIGVGTDGDPAPTEPLPEEPPVSSVVGLKRLLKDVIKSDIKTSLRG